MAGGWPGGRGQGQGRRAAGGAAAAAWPTEQLAADSPQPLAKCPGPRAAGLQVCDQFLLTKIMAMLIWPYAVQHIGPSDQ